MQRICNSLLRQAGIDSLATSEEEARIVLCSTSLLIAAYEAATRTKLVGVERCGQRLLVLFSLKKRR